MYVLETRDGEIARLGLQGERLAPQVDAMLAAIGVGPGWRCLDLGCGLGDVTRLLAARAGSSVTGIDINPRFLEIARAAAPELTYVETDMCASGLPHGGFDLVHGRFILGNSAPAETQIAEAVRLARPGGTVAFEEQEYSVLATMPPHPAIARLKALMTAGLEQSGTGRAIARRLFGMMRAAGLVNVRYRPFVVGVQSGDPFAQWLPEIVESMRGVLLGSGLSNAKALDEALASARAHLDDPGTTANLYIVAQVWGTKPQ